MSDLFVATIIHEYACQAEHNEDWQAMPCAIAADRLRAQGVTVAPDATGAPTGLGGYTLTMSNNAAIPVAPDATGLRDAGIATRDLLAHYLWNEDDSGDENDLVDAHDRLAAILGPSTEESVEATLAATPAAPPALDVERHRWGPEGMTPDPNGRWVDIGNPAAYAEDGHE